MDRCPGLWKRFVFDKSGEGTVAPGVAADGELAEGEDLLKGLSCMGADCELRVRLVGDFLRILFAAGLLFWIRGFAVV